MKKKQQYKRNPTPFSSCSYNTNAQSTRDQDQLSHFATWHFATIGEIKLLGQICLTMKVLGFTVYFLSNIKLIFFQSIKKKVNKLFSHYVQSNTPAVYKYVPEIYLLYAKKVRYTIVNFQVSNFSESLAYHCST